MRNKAAILAVNVALVAAVVGGALAFTGAQKNVVLSVDGKTREVSTFGDSVKSLLEAEGVDVGVRDTVAPAPGTQLADDLHVAVRHARPVTLTFDGDERQVWVTALDVDEALDQLGIRERGAVVSASRSQRIPLSGMALEVRTPREVTVVTKGRKRDVVTTAPTVKAALAAAGVEVRPRDRVSAALGAFPADGQVIVVKRVDVKRVTTRVATPYRTIQRATSSLYKGVSRVRFGGDKGLLLRTYSVTFVDGRKTHRKLVRTRVLDSPNPRIVLVGTKSRPAPVSTRSSSGSGSVAPTSDGLNWSALAACESGGNPQAYNPAGPYYGLYQFSLSTWQSVGGSGLPSNASSAEQTRRAQILYQRSGAGQWPVCGSRLFS